MPSPVITNGIAQPETLTRRVTIEHGNPTFPTAMTFEVTREADYLGGEGDYTYSAELLSGDCDCAAWEMEDAEALAIERFKELHPAPPSPRQEGPLNERDGSGKFDPEEYCE